MTSKFRIHTFKYLIAAGTSAVSLGMAVLMFYLHEWRGVVMFLLVACLFAWIAVLYGAVITIDRDEIRMSFWGIPIRKNTWNEIKEVGVVGTNIFRTEKGKYTGSRYIYFSTEPMDENERFRLAMKWPPGKMIYLLYTRERVDRIQAIWDNEISSYHAGDIFF